MLACTELVMGHQVYHISVMSFKNTICYFEYLLFNMWCEVEETDKLSCFN